MIDVEQCVALCEKECAYAFAAYYDYRNLWGFFLHKNGMWEKREQVHSIEKSIISVEPNVRKKKKTKITKTFEFKTEKQRKCVLYVYVALRGVRSIKRLKNLHEL